MVISLVNLLNYWFLRLEDFHSRNTARKKSKSIEQLMKIQLTNSK